MAAPRCCAGSPACRASRRASPERGAGRQRRRHRRRRSRSCLAPATRRAGRTGTWRIRRCTTLGDVVAAIARLARLSAAAVWRAATVIGSGGRRDVCRCAAMLGWRSPARATALRQLSAGVVGDPAPWIARDRHRAAKLRRDPRRSSPRAWQTAGSRGCFCSSRSRSSGSPLFWIAHRHDRARPRPRRGDGHLTAAGFRAAGGRHSGWSPGRCSTIALGLALLVRRVARRVLHAHADRGDGSICWSARSCAAALARSAGAVYSRSCRC